MRSRSRTWAVVAAGAGAMVGAAGVARLALDGLLWRPDALHVLVVAVSTTVMGLLLVWFRPNLRYGAIVLANGVVFDLTLLALAILLRSGLSGTGVPVHVAFAATYLLAPPLNLVWELQLICFPEGRFPSRGWKMWVIATSALDVVGTAAAFLSAGPGSIRPFGLPVATKLSGPLTSQAVHGAATGLESLLGALLPVVALVGLVVRMRRASPVVRQQMKWLVAAMVAAVIAIMAFPATLHPWHGARAAGEVLVLIAPFWIQGAIGVAVFRYHLWGIDVVLSKALSLAVASAGLSLLFGGAALGAGAMAGGVNRRLIVAEAVIAAVFVASRVPRRRLEGAVRRILYGDRPHGYAVLNGLGRDLTTAELQGRLGAAVADAVVRGLGVRWAETWAVEPQNGRGSSIGASGRARSPAAILPVDAFDAISQARIIPGPSSEGDWLDAIGRPAAVVPISRGAAVIGLIGCGDRPGEPIGDDDRHLLEAVAREAGMAMENRRLTSELAAQVDELEEQASELRRSRERLAHVQDEERRRISRDLHDGVQQQLVAVAAKLRRLSAQAASDMSGPLAKLADEAEDAVFGLQDLARGLYPSVLTDRGLGPALGAQAERLPADVRLEVEPTLVGARFEEAVEAGMYFVVLEALANCHKHAPGARVTITLRRDRTMLFLEVRDNGPGFEVQRRHSDSGNGMLNMADRMAAVGGDVEVESRPGVGTWVTARAPAMARVTSLVTGEQSSAEG